MEIAPLAPLLYFDLPEQAIFPNPYQLNGWSSLLD
tara:strand:- start:228 stop:332 length:105 start_codon:yes stop_codon:yes gene_type:complete